MNNNILYKIIISVLASVALISCSEWDEHYNGDSGDTSSLIEILESTADASEFIAVLKKTGLDKVVGNDDVFTVFVPPAGSFSAIADADLKEVVGNHIVFKRYYYENLMDSLSLRAANGKYLSVRFVDGKPFINNREKLIAIEGNINDLEALNGVVHSITELIQLVPNIEEQIANLDPVKFSIFLEYYNKFDSVVPDKEVYKLAFNDEGGVILSSDPLNYFASFNASDEANPYTLLVPSDEAILQQKADLLEQNGGYEEKISPYYYARLIRNQMLKGAFNNGELFKADTIITGGENWVVGKKLSKAKYANIQTASNGYLLESSEVVYKPIAADFVDSIVYEAEWALGIEGHKKSIIYTGELEPTIGGNGITLNHHLFVSSLLRNNRVQFFIPEVYKGAYEVKIAYKWSAISVLIGSSGVSITPRPINLESHIPRDINNTDANAWAYGTIGYTFLPEDGNLDISIAVTTGTYATLMIDKVVLVPIEY